MAIKLRPAKSGETDIVSKVPAHLSDVEAATLPCAALTAWSALVTCSNTLPGDHVPIPVMRVVPPRG